MKTTERKTYEAASRFSTFEERFDYLKLCDGLWHSEPDIDRMTKQAFYMSDEWDAIRTDIILRDDGCDLGIPGRDIHGKIYVHHIVPLTRQMLVRGDPIALDPSNLICTCYNTHKALHFGSFEMLMDAEPVTRSPNDTCPWKGGRL